jgi:hypothetical protein
MLQPRKTLVTSTAERPSCSSSKRYALESLKLIFGQWSSRFVGLAELLTTLTT